MTYMLISAFHSMIELDNRATYEFADLFLAGAMLLLRYGEIELDLVQGFLQTYQLARVLLYRVAKRPVINLIFL